MRLRLTFELTLLSDYHVGSGHRAGPMIDSALLRDHDKSPILRGTALAGLLRDGLRDLREIVLAAELTSWLDDDAELRLFGSAAQRKRWAFSSARSAEHIEKSLTRWGAQNVTRVRINPRTRRAEPQKLFMEEEGDAQLKFFFTATCAGATDRDQVDATLLAAVARMVRHLGSARRRGRGECRFTLINAEGLTDLPAGENWNERALLAFKTHWLDADAAPAAPCSALSTANTLSLDNSAANPRRRFRLIAYAVEPIIIARRSEAANAYETLPMIPGSALNGALADCAARALGFNTSDTATPEFVTLFLRGGIRVSGLFPARFWQDWLYATIPAPHSLFVCENYPAYDENVSEPHSIHDAIRDGFLDECSVCGGKLKPLQDFLSVQPYPLQVESKRREEAHIQMNRNTGRVKTGDLYEYVALEAGQWFVGELDCANEACWQRLQILTELRENQLYELRVGKASQRGYGLIRLLLQPLAAEAPSPLICRALNQRITDIDELRLTLLTDAIVLDTWGRFYASFDKRWIAAALKLKPHEIEITGECAAGRKVDTFNTHRRMPRWRDEAIVAGSTAGIKILPEGLQSLVSQWREKNNPDQPSAPPELSALHWKLAQIEAEGIGLRQHEGFGRVAFNHPLFSPADDLDEARISVSELVTVFKSAPTTHELQRELEFRKSWAKRLDESQSDKKQKQRWEEIDAEFEPVARLLFLSRNNSFEELQQRLSKMGKPEYLWNKRLTREKEEKINEKGRELIKELVARLNSMASGTRSHWAIGLKMLAERVALAAARERQQRGEK